MLYSQKYTPPHCFFSVILPVTARKEILFHIALNYQVIKSDGCRKQTLYEVEVCVEYTCTI